MRPTRSSRIHLEPERRAALVKAVQAHFRTEFDETLSDFRANALLDFFVRAVGPAVYNQGVRDAAAFMQGHLSDIETEVYERDTDR